MLALVELSYRRRLCRRPRRGGTAGPAGRADRGRDLRLARPAVQLGADQSRWPVQGTWPKPGAPAREPGPGPGRGRPWSRRSCCPGSWTWTCGRAAPATPRRTCGKRSDLAVRTGNWFDLRFGLSLCGDLCAATGRAAEALTLWAASAAADQHQRHDFPPWYVPRREEQMRQARQALGPGRARAAEERGAAMSLATAAEYALMLTDPGPPQPGGIGLWAAQRPGAGTGHPGRPRPHRHPDRGSAAHQRPYGQLSPGPCPGQDRLPPPRRPDPPGPQRGPRVAALQRHPPQCLWVVPPTATARRTGEPICPTEGSVPPPPPAGPESAATPSIAAAARRNSAQPAPLPVQHPLAQSPAMNLAQVTHDPVRRSSGSLQAGYAAVWRPP